MTFPQQQTSRIAAAVVLLAREWWTQSSRFEILSTYLEWRNLQVPARLLFAGCSVILGAVPVVMLASPEGPNGSLGAAVAFTAAVATVGLAGLWLWRWPTERVSLFFVLVADAAIGLTSMADQHPLAGLNGTQAFILMGFYVALFHTPRIMVVHLAWTIAVCTEIAATLAFGNHEDPVGAAAKLLLSLVIVVTVPLGAQVLLPVLSSDAAAAARDSLTGLLNRRGLEMALRARFVRSPTRSGLAIFVIDVDNFKSINDTFGHAVGDQVLHDVGQALAETMPIGEVARVGGEEFVIAASVSAEDIAHLAERLRENAIQTVGSRRMTVSIGVAWRGDVHTGADAVTMLPGLMREADKAMYRAKASGGDRVVVTPQDESVRSSE